MSASSLARRQPAPAASTPVTNAEKARALIAMLESGKDAPTGVTPDRLRDWASDLIRTVEGEDKAPTPAAPLRRRRLFTKAAPTLSHPTTPPAEHARTQTPQPVSTSRLTLTAPTPHQTKPTNSDVPSGEPSVFELADVAKIVEATLDPATLTREHPAIIAMTLLGRPSMEQAQALRGLAGGQVRAVHRALRQMEQARTRHSGMAGPGKNTFVSA